MKYSVKDKNKVLKKLLSAEWDTSTYLIKNIPAFEKSCSFVSHTELVYYLHILTFEHLIDAEIENNQIRSIFILPDAFSRQATNKSEKNYKNITLFFAIISTICTVIQVIDIILRII